MKKGKIAILVENNYQDQEVWYPYYRMKEAGFDVVVAGPKAGQYTSKFGYPIQAEAPASEVNANELVGVIIPGGWAPDKLRMDTGVLSLVGALSDAGKVVASICHGGWVLASADVVRGKKLTCYAAIKDDMVNAGAEFIDKEVVRDGNLITSRKPDDLPAFCREILNALKQSKGARARA